ncbi:MarR family transcriptional regulator [Cognatishimia sp. WU-CL00825]|uniref:MarR family winged helix-turn-helix transcriptional regulator n=1 Tax=Cognatishimia sp. WU-CL00825 TaxID=3127658 RepID=UPI003102ECF4
MTNTAKFDLLDFLPYLMTQSADALSLEFQPAYKDRYGMLRTEWRVLFHVGRYKDITAKEICDRARLHKTKVSRAVTALEQKNLLARAERQEDRRHASLTLTAEGQAVFRDLTQEARAFNEKIKTQLGSEDAATLQRILTQIADL